ncbi:fibronectin type III domain-containing protein [Solibacillus silvestris]|uniref:fibronectin type III domain-containing protein n=1 Tax=Solibacillus silvestris TaxID=76853 RepID=UPI0002EB8C3A|nr:fibronectin type III domain-containing protein [Solibacillus silvestris]
MKLGGTINVINVLKSAKLQIENGATITTLNVAGNLEADITNNGVITKLAGNGTAIERGLKANNYEGPIGENTAVAAIKATISAGNMEAVLLAYHLILGISDLADYKNLAPSYKSAVNTMLYNEKTGYLNATAIKIAFNEAIATQKAFSAIKNAMNASSLGVVFNNDHITLGIDLTEYNSLTNKTTVNQAIFNARNSFATVVAFQTVFNNSVATAKTTEAKDLALSLIQMQRSSVSDKQGSGNNGQVTVNWKPLTIEDISKSGATSYVIYYAEGIAVSKDTAGAKFVKVTNLNSSSLDISGLEAGTDYATVIYAVNASDVYSPASSTITAQAKDYIAATAGKLEGGIVLADDSTVKNIINAIDKHFLVTIDGAAIPVMVPAATETKSALLNAINTAISSKGVADFLKINS